MIPTLYDKTGNNKIGELTESIKCFVEEERNGIFELTMIYPVNSSILESIVYDNIIVADANDYLKSQKFRIYNTRKLMANRIEICARHISFDLAHDWVDSISIENQSCEYALNTIFRNSQFSKHFKGHSDIINAQNFKVNKVTCLEAIGGTSGSIVDTYGTGAEILRDNTDIHVLNRRGRDNDVVIEYRKNLTGLEVEEDTTDLVTRIMPYAIYTDEDNQEVEVRGDFIDSPLINNYAHPYVKYIDYSEKFEDDEVPTATKLNNLATKEYTNNKVDIPKCNYKIEFVPLSKCAGYEGLEDRINLCDVVTVKDSRYNIDTQAKVIKVTYNVLRDRYESMELGEPKTTLGDIIGGTGDGPTQGPPGPPGPQGPAGADGSIGDFPETLPEVPNINAKVYGFANIELSWTFENKVYYSYELYASKTKGFTPNTFNLIFSGQASTYLYQVEPNETWYFRACALNTHGQRTDFSKEIEVSTVKISDLSNYVESAAIGDALIGELNLGRGWYGELRGNYIDAKQMSVTDGNGKRTLDIDSFGNVNLDVTSLKIRANSVATESFVTTAKNDAITSANNTLNTTIANYYTKSETDSQINVAKDSINLGVSQTYETKTNVETKIGNIQVGGSNLIRGSKDFTIDSSRIKGFLNDGGYTKSTEGDYGVMSRSQTGVTSNTIRGLCSSYIPCKKGDKFTVSFWMKVSDVNAWDVKTPHIWEVYNSSKSRIQYQDVGVTASNTNKPTVKSGEWVLMTSTHEVTADEGVYCGVRLSLFRNGSISFKQVQIEKGNKATDWSPCSLDIDNAISTAKTEAIDTASADATSKVNSAKNELNTAIGKKANSVDVYNKTEVYTRNETDSRINIAKDEINLGVSSTYETKTNVETKISNIQVGATNLLVGTATAKNTNVNVPTAYVTWDAYTTHNKQTLEQLGFKVGDKVTVGFDWSISKNGTNNYVYGNFRVEFKGIKSDGTDNQYLGTIKNPAGTFSSSSTKGRVEATVALDSATIKAHSLRFRIDNSVLNFKVSNLKMEKGTKATGWSPAPEDTTTDITNAKNEAISTASTDATTKVNSAKSELNTAINKKANSSDVYVKSEVYTKAQTNSQIKVAKDEINLGVSNTYETKANVETKVNTTLNSAKSYADTKKSEAISSAATDAANKVNAAKSELNTEINKKANSADVYKKTEVYTKNETNSQITTAKNEINQSVSSTYETKTNVTTKLNNLSVSATNLMDNSAPLSTSGWVGWSSVSGLSTSMEVSTTDNSTHGKQGKITFSGSVTCQAGRHKNPVQRLTSGKTYSWSIWLRSESGNLTVQLGQEQNGLRDVTVGTSWTRFTHTYTANDGQHYAFIIRPKNVTSSHSLYFHSVMLVEGDKPVAWQTSPTEVLSDKTSIEQRMNSAESKITDTAITNVVKQNFYTKEETNNQITSKDYQTSSQVQQTVDNLQIKFTQSGGYNMIRNSLSRQGSKYWYTGRHGGSGDIKFHTTSINNTRTRLEFTVAGLNSALGGVMSAPVPVVAGKKYTMSCDVEVQRGQNIGFEVMFWSRENWGYSTNPDVAKHLLGTFKSGKVTNTFTAPANAQFMQVYFWGKYISESTQWNYAHYFISNLIVCEGELATAWSPHPNEVYEGLTTIDRDGIKVSTSNGAYTHFSADGMDSYDNDGNMTLGLRNGGMTFHAWNNREYVGYISQTAAPSTGYNGVSLGMTPLGDYISLGVSSNATDPNSGFSHSSYFVIAQHDNYDNNTLGLNAYKNLNMHGWDITNGGTFTAGVFCSKSGMKFKGNSPIYFDGDATHPSAIWEDNNDGMVRFYGDNGIIMGYKNGNTNEQCFYIKESKDGLGCRIGMYDNLNMNGWKIRNATVNNGSFRFDEYTRTSADYVSIFKYSDSSKSEMNIELANDYVTWFNIQANNYVDKGKYIARFNYRDGSEASNVGIHFYRAVNAHGYNITNVGNMSVYALQSEELEVNDIRVSTPFAVMSRSGEQTSLSVTKSIDDLTEANGTVTISNKQAKVELPQGLIFTDYYVQVTGNKIANLAVTARTDEYFMIETDFEEEIEAFYTIKAFQPKYVTRTSVYGEPQGEAGTVSATYEEAMAEELARTAQLLSAGEGSKPADLSKPGEPEEIVKDSFHT